MRGHLLDFRQARPDLRPFIEDGGGDIVPWAGDAAGDCGGDNPCSSSQDADCGDGCGGGGRILDFRQPRPDLRPFMEDSGSHVFPWVGDGPGDLVASPVGAAIPRGPHDVPRHPPNPPRGDPPPTEPPGSDPADDVVSAPPPPPPREGLPEDKPEEPPGSDPSLDATSPYALACPDPDSIREEDVEIIPFESWNDPGVDDDVIQHLVAVPVGPNNPVREELIVLLHGAGGTTGGVFDVAWGFAAAGFRTIALAWNTYGGTAREVCLPLVDNDVQLNGCLDFVRWARLYAFPTDTDLGSWLGLTFPSTVSGESAIIPNLEALLDTLGWSEFLTPSGAPRWRDIIFAGYSEGANETAYALRQLPLHGAILISAGGDRAQIDPDATELANWMTQEPVDPHRVGFRHADEYAEFNHGWDLDGLPTDEVRDVQDIDSFYVGFRGAHRAVRTDPVANPHGSTTEVVMRPVHMYLACKAASG